MNSLNSLLLEGRLTADVVMKATPNGTTIATFSIASERFFKTKDAVECEVSYFDVEAWSKLADRCGELKKGRTVRVVGRLKQDRWIDADGKNHSRVKVVAEHVEPKPTYAREPETAQA